MHVVQQKRQAFHKPCRSLLRYSQSAARAEVRSPANDAAGNDGTQAQAATGSTTHLPATITDRLGLLEEIWLLASIKPAQRQDVKFV